MSSPLSSQLTIALEEEEDFPAASHIDDCRLRILCQGTYNVDPSDWHLLLGCRYAPFNDAFRPPVLAFWPRAGSIHSLPPYVAATGKANRLEVQTIDEMDVEALLKWKEDETGALEENDEEVRDVELLEMMVSAIHCSIPSLL